MTKKIKELLTKKEDNRLDFKVLYDFSNSKHKKNFVKAICSIANSILLYGGTGYLIIGYDNKKDEIVGINDNQYNEEMLQQIISANTDSPPSFKYECQIYNEKYLGIITIFRNLNGPHQWKWGGFPIRRGPTTDFMTASEIKQIITKISKPKSRKSEYDLLSNNERKVAVLNDIISIFEELDLKDVVKLKYKGVTGQYYPFDYISCMYPIEDKITNIIITVNLRGEKKDLFRSHYSQNGFLKEYDVNFPIFINIYTTNIVNTYYKDLISSHQSLVKTNISNKTDYFGMGMGFNKKKTSYSDYYIPNFYSSKIKSRDEIKEEIINIMDWIKNNSEFFFDTLTFLKGSKKG